MWVDLRIIARDVFLHQLYSLSQSGLPCKPPVLKSPIRRWKLNVAKFHTIRIFLRLPHTPTFLRKRSNNNINPLHLHPLNRFMKWFMRWYKSIIAHPPIMIITSSIMHLRRRVMSTGIKPPLKFLMSPTSSIIPTWLTTFRRSMSFRLRILRSTATSATNPSTTPATRAAGGRSPTATLPATTTLVGASRARRRP